MHTDDLLTASAGDRLRVLLMRYLRSVGEPGVWMTVHDDDLCAALRRSRRTVQDVLRAAREDGVLEVRTAARDSSRQVRVVAEVQS